jgi:uncharacterized protein YndB with AHSA1/START domain
VTLEIEKTIQLTSSPQRVWRAITEADEITAWFPETIQWDQQIGSEGWFGWANHGQYAMRIEQFEPPTFMAWRWARQPDKPLAETDTTLVEWTLTPREDGGTTLHLKETGFKSEEARSDNDGGWDAELGEMIVHLGETGATIV